MKSFVSISARALVWLSLSLAPGAQPAAQSLPLLDDVAQVAAGGNHTCARTTAGTVQCWGRNLEGQLGNGSATSAVTPLAVSGLTSVSDIAAGGSHSCALTMAGVVLCWGDNSYGQLGNGSVVSSSVPVPVDGLVNVVELSAGGNHTCARDLDGAVWCWGDNASGQLGDGQGSGTTQSNSPSPVMADLVGAVKLSAGEFHTCAITVTGSVHCWGNNGSGQLGTGNVSNALTPQVVAGLPYATDLAAGRNHTCVLTGSGGVSCWGLGSSGQIGSGSTTLSSSPLQVAGLVGMAEISAGAVHTCSRTATSEVFCWGGNSSGQLGVRNDAGSSVPVQTMDLEDVSSIALGGLHSCALVSGGTVRCWGENSQGQLGIGSTTRATSPSSVNSLLGPDRISVGRQHSCATVTSGRVLCWGSNGFGQLGTGSTGGVSTAVSEVPGLSESVEVVSGAHHNCIRTKNSTVACWGLNQSGQIGIGSVGGIVSSPTVVSGLADVVQLAAGSSHTCARTRSQTVLCWGANAAGQLGNGSTTNAASPVMVPGLVGAVEISAGFAHTCARTISGEVRCWGSNSNGRLGNGTTSDALTPVTVAGLNGVVEIAAGGTHSCARLSNGTLQCWGSNTSGQLGNGTTLDSFTPAAVTGLVGAIDLATGFTHTCARTVSGEVKCWGGGEKLGNGSAEDSLTPVPVAGLSGARELAAGEFHTCVRGDPGLIRCWGNNDAGQLGDGFTTNQPRPVKVAGLPGVAHIAAGGSHTCVASAVGGVAQCWGGNDFGQIGDGGTGLAATPQVVDGLSGVSELSAGRNHTCASTVFGALLCWGKNASGQLGDGSNADAVVPVAVGGIFATTIPATHLTLGDSHTCALASGAVYCWGDNSEGQLGNGTNDDSNTPIVIAGLSGVSGLAAGDFHTCAIVSAGEVRCWGSNDNGQLGNGSTIDSLTPVVVSGLSRVVQIVAGGTHTCARLDTGEVRCWGDNASGQLGNGGTLDAITSVAVSGLAPVVEITAGGAHTCGRTSEGDLRCWGSNTSGQLGNASTTRASTPVAVAGLSDVTQVAAGRAHTCARREALDLTCWGSDDSGQLGRGLDTRVPNAVADPSTTTQLVPASAVHVVNTPLSVTVTVSANPGGAPLGSVDFRADGTSISNCSAIAVIGSGDTRTATCSTSALTVGTRSLTAAYSGDGRNFGSTSEEVSISIREPDFQFAPATAPAGTFGVSGYVAGPITVSSAAATGVVAPVTYQLLNALDLPPGLNPVVSGGLVVSGTPTQAGTYTFRVRAADSSSSSVGGAFSAERDYTIVINKAVQTVAFGTAPSILVGGVGAVSATGGPSGNPVVFSSQTPSVCTVTGNTVSGLAAGSCVVAANQSGNANYLAAAEQTQTFAIGRANQSLSFGENPGPLVFNGASGSVIASATSGLPVTYGTTTPTLCSVDSSSGAITILGAGSCTATADQAGNANFNAASRATQVVVIDKAAQAISLGNAPAVTVGSSGPMAATGGGSGNPVVFVSQTQAICSLSMGTVSGIAAGDCTVAANQAGSANYLAAPEVTQTFSIGRGSQTISFGANPGPLAFNGVSGSVSASATSGLSVVYGTTTAAVCSVQPSIGAISILGAGDCIVTADQAGNANYNAAPRATQTVIINKAAQVIIGFSPPTVRPLDDGTFTLSATAGSGLPVSFSSLSPSTCTVATATVTPLAPGACQLRASQAGDGNWLGAADVDATVSIQVAPTVELVSSPNPSDIGSAVTLTATVTGIAPSGTMRFRDGTSTIGGCSAQAISTAGNVGTATCVVSSLVRGNRTLSAVYSGDSNNTTQVSPEVTQLVEVPTQISIGAITPNPCVINTNCQVSVIVSSTGGTPTGSVTVSSTAGGSCVFNLSGGTGSCSLQATTSGSGQVTANYAGQTPFKQSEASVSHTFNNPNQPPVLSFNPSPGAVVFGGAGTTVGSEATGSVEIATVTAATGTGATTLSCSVSGGNFLFSSNGTPNANFGSFNLSTTTGSIGMRCLRQASSQQGTLTCTPTNTPGGQQSALTWSLSCPGADNASPTVSFSPAPGPDQIVMPVVAVGQESQSSIGVNVSGGVGTGQTTLSCALAGGTSAAYRLVSGGSQTLGVGGSGAPITVGCTAATSQRPDATLTCTRTRQPENSSETLNWQFRCPAGTAQSNAELSVETTTVSASSSRTAKVAVILTPGANTFAAQTEITWDGTKLEYQSANRAPLATACTKQVGRNAVFVQAQRDAGFAPGIPQSLCTLEFRPLPSAAGRNRVGPEAVLTRCRDGSVSSPEVACQARDGAINVTGLSASPPAGETVVASGSASGIARQSVQVGNLGTQPITLACGLRAGSDPALSLDGTTPTVVAAGPATVRIGVQCQLPLNAAIVPEGVLECATSDPVQNPVSWRVRCQVAATGTQAAQAQFSLGGSANAEFGRSLGELPAGGTPGKGGSGGTTQLVVGAPKGGGDFSGQIYLLSASGASTTTKGLSPAMDQDIELIRVLEAPRGGKQLQQGELCFGRAVAISASGAQMAVGAPGRCLASGNSATFAGEVLVYDRPAEGWGEAYNAGFDFTARLGVSASSAVEPGEFGRALGFGGENLLVVGAPGTDIIGLGADLGRAYLCRKPATAWTCADTDILDSPNRVSNGRFGEAVASGEGFVVIGAPGEGAQNSRRGASYLVPIVNGDPLLPAVPLTPGITLDLGSRLGSALHVDGDLVFVGAPFADTAAGTDSGIVHVFRRRADNTVVEVARLLPSTETTPQELGRSISSRGRALLVGAPAATEGANAQQGRVYRYRMAESWRTAQTYQGEVRPEAVMANAGGAASDRFGDAVVAGASSTLVGAPLAEDGATTNAGRVDLFQLPDVFVSGFER